MLVEDFTDDAFCPGEGELAGCSGIPFDIYSRLASDFGWGREPRWTHFDGYQLWKAGRLRALVGGDVRYGGRHHICSIGVDDERAEVVTRLAVVSRKRFAVTRAASASPGA